MESFNADSAVFGVLLILLVGLVMALVWAFLFHWIWGVAARMPGRLGISRRQQLNLGYGVGLVCTALLVLAIVDASKKSPRPFTRSAAVKSVVEGNTAFALDLYQKLKGNPGNLFFSPYSVSTALGMTYAGARGRTESEIGKTAHFNLPQDD
ncbi:MAG: serpin, partial [Verrucomicrobiota bacterium]